MLILNAIHRIGTLARGNLTHKVSLQNNCIRENTYLNQYLL